MSGIKGFFDNASAKVGFNKAPKTVDPEYTSAKEIYHSLFIDAEKLIGSVICMEKRITQLSDTITSLTKISSEWTDTAPQGFSAQLNSLSQYSTAIQNRTNNFLSSRVDPHFVKPFTLFQTELNRLKGVKENRKISRRKYDTLRKKVEEMHAKNERGPKVNETEASMEQQRVHYEKLNTEFIESVQKLLECKEQSLEIPIKNLISLLAQYMSSLFTDLQQTRSVFPEHVFQPKAAPIPKQKPQPEHAAPLAQTESTSTPPSYPSVPSVANSDSDSEELPDSFVHNVPSNSTAQTGSFGSTGKSNFLPAWAQQENPYADIPSHDQTPLYPPPPDDTYQEPEPVDEYGVPIRPAGNYQTYQPYKAGSDLISFD